MALHNLHKKLIKFTQIIYPDAKSQDEIIKSVWESLGSAMPYCCCFFSKLVLFPTLDVNQLLHSMIIDNGTIMNATNNSLFVSRAHIASAVRLYTNVATVQYLGLQLGVHLLLHFCRQAFLHGIPNRPGSLSATQSK